MLVTQEFSIKANDEIILEDINLDFGPGIHIIMGPNGVGKSTLLMLSWVILNMKQTVQ